MARHVIDRKFGRDLAVAVIIVVVTATVAVACDLTERWFAFTRTYEHWELDELLPLLIGLLCGTAWFATARMREAWRQLAQRQAFEDRLKEQQHLYRSILDHSPVEIYVKDLQGRHVVVNRREEELFGDRCGGVLGKTAFDLFPEPSAREHEAHDRDVIKAGTALEREYKIPMDDGLHTFLAVKFPIRGADGEIVRIGAVVTDITDRKKSECEALEAKETAEKASKAKSRFLAAASHDLRQPLQAMGLLAGNLSETELNPRQSGLVDAMGEAIGSAGSMLSVLLDISELDAGSIVPQAVDFDLDALLQRLFRDFALRAEEKQLDLRLVPSGLTVHSDPVLLERMISNLVSNALRYTEAGRILIGCRRQGADVEVQVWDTGVGIEAKNLEKIFDEYFQVGNAARDRRKGLGLGLALVHRLSALLDHPVRVASVFGRGSMFAIRIPLGDSTAASAPPGPTSVEALRNHASILLVEDDEAVLEATARLLRQWGYRVAAARSGEDAVKMCESGAVAPDVVVADYRLPDGIDGIGAVLRLRGSLGPELPSIIVTGDTSDQVTQAVAEAGCDLLHKPVAPAKLRALLRHRLDGKAKPLSGETAA